jgi:deoxycytidylate deaminase
MQVKVDNLSMSDEVRQQLVDFDVTAEEIAEVVQASMSGLLPTIGRGIKRTERTKNGHYLYVAYIPCNNTAERIQIWEVYR